MHNVVNFDNAYVDHLFNGSHKLQSDFDANCHRIISPKSLGGTLGDAIVYLGPSGCYAGLQAAINDLPATGGTVYILPGYTETITASVTFPSDNIAIICPTCDAVITDGTGVNMFHLTSRDWLTISGLKFVGIPANGASRGVYGGNAEHLLLNRCWFSGCYYGVVSAAGAIIKHSSIRDCYFSGGGVAGMLIRQSDNLRIDSCIVDGSMSYGIDCDDINDSLIIANCGVANVGIDGYYIVARSRYGTIRLSNCVAYQCTRFGYDFRQSSTTLQSPIQVSNCAAIGNGQHGFYQDGAATLICTAIYNNCVAIDNGTAAANTYSGFYLNEYCDRTQFIGCQAHKYGASNQKYGVQINANNDKCEIRGGRWYPNQTAAWLDNGTGTIIDARDD